MSLPELDNTCKNILQYLIALHLGHKGPIRFNELLRSLKKSKYKTSRPTLDTHLKHLVEKELVLRTQVGKQHVTYRFYPERWDPVTEYFEKGLHIEKFFIDEKDEFNAASPEAQIAHTWYALAFKSILQLKHSLLKISEPEKEFEHNLSIISFESIWTHFKAWLIENYEKNNKDYRRTIIDLLETIESDLKTPK